MRRGRAARQPSPSTCRASRHVSLVLDLLAISCPLQASAAFSRNTCVPYLIIYIYIHNLMDLIARVLSLHDITHELVCTGDTKESDAPVSSKGADKAAAAG